MHYFWLPQHQGPLSHLSLCFIASFIPQSSVIVPNGKPLSVKFTGWQYNTRTIRNRNEKLDTPTSTCVHALHRGHLVRTLSPAELSFTNNSANESLYYIWLIYNFILYTCKNDVIWTWHSCAISTRWFQMIRLPACWSLALIQSSWMVRSAASGTNRKLK